MLFKETVAVYCENHTEHTDTVRTSQETHYLLAAKPNWLIVAVYCENNTESTDTVLEKKTENACVYKMAVF
jgi:hypothetical protein